MKDKVDSQGDTPGSKKQTKSRRRISLKSRTRWAVLLGGLSLVAGSVYGIHRFQLDRLGRSIDEHAAKAIDEGDFPKAVTLYAEHLAVAPDDVETQLNYADALLKGSPTPSQQSVALTIFDAVLQKHPGRGDVRRRRTELRFSVGSLGDSETQSELQILLDSPDGKRDGHLLFLLGRCCEANKYDGRAKECYQAAIKNQAPEKFEAYERLASLVRQSSAPTDTQAADDLMDEMVWSSPEDYHVYVARCRYRRQFGVPGSKDDIEKALSLAGEQPQVYIEMARDAEADSDPDQARRILTAGLKKVPGSAALISGIAYFELRAGRIDDAIETLQRGLNSGTNDVQLHWAHADLLAMRGDTGKLLLEIEELKNIGLNSKFLNLITGHYYVNASKFPQARETLAPLERLGWPPEFKARLSVLLARCYSQLGEPELRHQAYVRALNADPRNVKAKLGLIDQMIRRGEVDQAISEYRQLIPRVPKVGLLLARLLIAQNQRQPAEKRDWSEVITVLDQARKSMPDSDQASIVRAEFEMARDKPARAREVLSAARTRFPKNLAVRCAQANVMVLEKKFDEANRLLDETAKELGDGVAVRLQQARLFVAKGGPNASAHLNELSENIESYTKADRRELLIGLAEEFARLQDLSNASRLRSRWADQDPDDIQVRLGLFDLAIEMGDSQRAGHWMTQIQKIEGTTGSLGTLCEVQYLIWQAGRAIEKDPPEARRLQSKARLLLEMLESRRHDLSAVPLAFARLEQQSLRQGGLTEAETKAKEESIINSYSRAISLGQRGPAIVRETVRLLCKHKRLIEALELVRSMPVESELASNLEQAAFSSVVDKRELERAEMLARKALAAKPADLPERMWLVRILTTQGRLAEAEAVLREAVALGKTDPDRWTVLIGFLIQSKRNADALKAIKHAESVLPASAAPLVLANSYALLGGAYEDNDDVEKQKAYAQAKEWFTRALADHPDDLAAARSAAEFFTRTNQTVELEAELEAILKRGSKATTPWARRRLALLLASSTDQERVRRALSIIDPSGRGAKDSPRTKPSEHPDDLRALVRVLEAQRTVAHRTRAIAILDSLVSKNLATGEDRMLLARLEEASGHWPKALAVFRDPKLSTLNTQDRDAVQLRPYYLAQFARGLLRNHKPGDDAGLAEAQTLVDELAERSPDLLDTVVLRVNVYTARKQIYKALELIERSARRPNLTPDWLKTLARSAERLEQMKVAERLYRRYAASPKIGDGAVTLAAFLGRHGRVNDALDVLAPMWSQNRDVEALAATSFQLIVASEKPVDDVQFERVAAWLDGAIQRNQTSAQLVLILGDLRAEQRRLDDAETLYRQVVEHVSQSGLTQADQNTTLARAHNNLAWLATFKERQGENALAEVNRAISLIGAQADLLDTRGLVHLSLGQTKDAIKDLESAVSHGSSPNRLFHLSQAYFQANQKEKSKRCLREAKAKGLDQRRVGPSAVHWLERSTYQRLLTELGIS